MLLVLNYVPLAGYRVNKWGIWGVYCFSHVEHFMCWSNAAKIYRAYSAFDAVIFTGTQLVTIILCTSLGNILIYMAMKLHELNSVISFNQSELLTLTVNCVL